MTSTITNSVISGAPTVLVYRGSPVPLGSTRKDATTATTVNHLVRRAVAASTNSGQVQYQGCTTGASATVRASARPAWYSGSRVRARHQSQTSSTARRTTAI